MPQFVNTLTRYRASFSPHFLGFNAQNVNAPLVIGHPDVDFPVETAEPPQRRLEHVGPVGCGNHHDGFVGLQAVHQGQELGDHALLDFTAGRVALRGNRVHLDKEGSVCVGRGLGYVVQK